MPTSLINTTHIGVNINRFEPRVNLNHQASHRALRSEASVMTLPTGSAMENNNYNEVLFFLLHGTIIVFPLFLILFCLNSKLLGLLSL